MPTPRMEDMMEGGFINDRSGKATEAVRRKMTGAQSSEAENKRLQKKMRPLIRRQGNPALKSFK